jgi:DNA-binding transcriptional regulator of glucitol operon
MEAALITILAVALAGLLGIVQWQMSNFGHRLDRVEDGLLGVKGEVTEVKISLATIGQKLDDHIVDHPAAGRRA